MQRGAVGLGNGYVFAFVFVMAMMLWVIDAGLLWVTQKLLGQGG